MLRLTDFFTSTAIFFFFQTEVVPSCARAVLNCAANDLKKKKKLGPKFYKKFFSHHRHFVFFLGKTKILLGLC